MRYPAIFQFLAALTSGPLAAETFSTDVWADSWFEMRVNGVQVAVDSVPIITERSFDAESFAFEAERPFVIGLVARDFIQDDTGLECIGTRHRQMGDGGVIAQIMDASGEVVAVTDGGWQCRVLHRAPPDPACADAADPVAGVGACGHGTTPEPEGRDRPGFDASAWPWATVHTAAEVDPKVGYDRIDRTNAADLIWGPDLKRDNMILCRVTVE
jgi:hypothetical protein